MAASLGAGTSNSMWSMPSARGSALDVAHDGGYVGWIERRDRAGTALADERDADNAAIGSIQPPLTVAEQPVDLGVVSPETQDAALDFADGRHRLAASSHRDGLQPRTCIAVRGLAGEREERETDDRSGPVVAGESADVGGGDDRADAAVILPTGRRKRAIEQDATQYAGLEGRPNEEFGELEEAVTLDRTRVPDHAS
jgi:hypothetical protein